MARRGRHFNFGEGIVSGDYEQTIRNIGYVGRKGMRDTDVTILNLMIDQ
jgi:L-cysteine desulfidase